MNDAIPVMAYPSPDELAHVLCIRREGCVEAEWTGPEDGVLPVSYDLENDPAFAEIPWPLVKIGHAPEIEVSFFRRQSETTS